ncbi:MAG: hypothetical protein JWP01_3979 [Myxococcales bacterium]|nr:hypothetical protein [Myxococcales bacterium]
MSSPCSSTGRSATLSREAALPGARHRRRAVTARVFNAAATRSSSSAVSSRSSATMTSCASCLYAVTGLPVSVASIRARTAASCSTCRRSRARSRARRGAIVRCRVAGSARAARDLDRSRDRDGRFFGDRRTLSPPSLSGPRSSSADVEGYSERYSAIRRLINARQRSANSITSSEVAFATVT